MEIKVEKYCANCPDFNPILSNRAALYADGKEQIIFPSVIICSNQDLCTRLRRQFGLKDEENT